MSSSSERPQKLQQRLPAPSLFVGPPSRPASIAEHRRPSAAPHGSARDFTTLSQRNWHDAQHGAKKNSRESGDATLSRDKDIETPNQQRRRGSTEQSVDKKADAMWAEMQNTLEEVELSAASRSNVFSADHARALEELRKAQIELAQAWARSEAEDEAHESGSPSSGNVGVGSGEVADQAIPGRKDAGKAEKAQNANAQSSRFRSSSLKSKGHLEEEADNDIAMARQRRLANDQYFERVNKGVVDVVAKLEVVAKKMRDVETESQEIWGSEQDSLETSSIG